MGNAQFPQHFDTITAFTQSMREAGIETEAFIQADGQRHRFRVIGDKSGKENGWYVLHLDGVPAGAFGCWKRGVSETWCAQSASSMTDAERHALHERIEASKREQEAEKARVHADCKAKAERLWNEAAKPVSIDHPYLKSKGVKPYGLRQMNEALMVPVCGTDGEMVGLQFIQPDGTKRPLTGTPMAGSYHRITGSMERVLICEGYATGASLREATGFAVAIAFNAGNLMAVAQAIRDKLPDADIVLCAEDDRMTSGNPGMTKATAAALAVDGLLAVPAFPAGADGTDFNDMHQLAGIEAVSAAVAAACSPDVQHEAAEPDHVVGANHMAGDVAGVTERHAYAGGEYQLSPHGVFFSDGKDSKWLCSPLHVVAKTRDAKSGEWGRLLQWSDADAVVHRWAMPMELLQGDGSDVRRELARQGLGIAPGRGAREHLASYLQVWPIDARARCVDRLGWHGGVYLTPSSTVGDSVEIVVFQNAHALEPALSQSGTLKDWRDSVAALSAGNSRMVFAICVAFTGPLAEIAGGESGGFHLRGDSSTGKSTAQHIACSVWGDYHTYKRSWRAAGNGMEGMAALHNDGLLVLDEMGMVDAREIGDIAYMLANGAGKNRASQSGAARKASSWRVVFLSSGEVSLATHAASAGKRTHAGQEVRFADIAADTGAGMGAIEALHGHAKAAALIDALNVASAKHYGTAGMVWLGKIVADRSALAVTIADAVQQFVAEAVPAGASGQVMRVARRFAVVATAGELATHYGITGWREGDASDATMQCFKSWLEGFGGGGNREQQTMLAQVRAFFEAHGASRFEDVNASNDQRVHNRAGFYRNSSSGEREYLVMPEAFKSEICKGLDHKAVATELVELGWLQPEKDGSKTVSTALPGIRRTRVYLFTSLLWSDAA